MSIPDLVGKAQTVLGPIEPENLGITLPHEHCLIDMSVWFVEPQEATGRKVAREPLSYDNLWYVRYHPYHNRDNVQLLDEKMAVEELTRYRLAGGSTLVDMTNVGIGRDPLALARISRATGLNIVMGAGYYVEESLPAGVKMGEEEIARDIVRDIAVGVGDTGIRAGLIGEIGIKGWPLTEGEKVFLHAAVIAQKETGAFVNIHTGRSPSSPFEVVEFLDKAGADVTRVVMSHIDRTLFYHESRVSLAKSGCVLEYDMFAFEGWMPENIRMVYSEDDPRRADLPNDAERLNQLIALADEGFIGQLLVSHDHCFKTRLCRYGGPGYAHLLNNVVPLMRTKGMTEDQIRALLVVNPGRLLTFA
jgi:phosphotriesterase-related protein